MDPDVHCQRKRNKTRWSDSYLYNPVGLAVPCCVAVMCAAQQQFTASWCFSGSAASGHVNWRSQPNHAHFLFPAKWQFTVLVFRENEVFICSADQFWKIIFVNSDNTRCYYYICYYNICYIFIKAHSFTDFVILILEKMNNVGNVCAAHF